MNQRVWSSSRTYVLRNYKYSADCIAKLGHRFCTIIGTVWLDIAPSSVMEELQRDNVL